MNPTNSIAYRTQLRGAAKIPFSGPGLVCLRRYISTPVRALIATHYAFNYHDHINNDNRFTIYIRGYF